MKPFHFNQIISSAWLLALLVCAAVANAKTNAKHAYNRRPSPIAGLQKNRSQVSAIVKKQQAALQSAKNATARTASSDAERLIATSSYNLSYADTPQSPVGITDSAAFVYIGPRGSVYNPYLSYFLTPYGSTFTAGAVLYDYLTEDIGQFTSNVNVSDVLADSAWYWNSNNEDSVGNYFLELGEQVFETYDDHNNVTFCTDQASPLDSSGQWDNFINTYDTNNNVAVSLDLQFSGMVFDSNSYTYFYYDSDGKLIEDSVSTYVGGVWAPESRDYYTYNSLGYITYSAQWLYSSGTWRENTRCSLSYNSDNALHSDSLSIATGSTWRVVEADSFGYTPGISYWTSKKTNINYTSTEYFNYVYSYHVNSANLPDTLYELIYSNFSSYTNLLLYSGKFSTAYDSYNNPTIGYAFDFDVTDSVTGAWVYDTAADRATHFYYQEYNLGVEKANPSVTAVTVFPNPAGNNINISIAGITLGTRINLRLENMLGQTIITENMPWISETQALPLSVVAPGAYVLLVQDGSGSTLSANKIIKQ